jgi:hypothetical protein
LCKRRRKPADRDTEDRRQRPNAKGYTCYRTEPVGRGFALGFAPELTPKPAASRSDSTPPRSASWQTPSRTTGMVSPRSSCRSRSSALTYAGSRWRISPDRRTTCDPSMLPRIGFLNRRWTVGASEDLGGYSAFLISPHAASITGTDYVIEGGTTPTASPARRVTTRLYWKKPVSDRGTLEDLSQFRNCDSSASANR